MISARNALRKLALALPAIGAVLALGAGTAPASADAAAITLGGAAPAGTTVAATAASTRPAVTPQVAYSCSPGFFCIYSGFNGTGSRCQWAQRSVRATTTNCSWIRRGLNVRSVRNSTSHRVQYYRHDNFNGRVGSTLAGRRGNLEGTYQVRSFRPQ